jgi:D-sedoheptulose 7-phosphate isomerase
MTQTISNALYDHLKVCEQFFNDNDEIIDQVADDIAVCLGNGGKILSCGNGGSACDAMHLVGEIVGRFVDDRPGMPAIALSSDSSILTAVGNDYGFDHVFARQVEAYGRGGDILIAISTSGSSPNVVKALEQAKERELRTVLLTGERGRNKTDYANTVLAVPSMVTARIQEVHITLIHLLIELVEKKIGY